MIGFLMPNKKCTKKLSSYVVPVDEIELLSNIDFFPQLDNELENEIEKEISTQYWDFSNTAQKHHEKDKAEASTKRCKGIAKSTGLRCKKSTNNKNGYCHYHQ